MESKKWFFGWTNIKFVIVQLILMWSDQPSLFSKKRAESNIAFIAGVGILLGHYYITRHRITTFEVCEIATILIGIAGYYVKKTQDEKELKQ